MNNGRALIRSPRVRLAWYPARGKRCTFGRNKTRPGTGRHFSAALGPLYLGLGSGVPLP